MQLYRYNTLTGEYGGVTTAQKRPNGEYITDVLGATVLAPPEIQEGYAALFSGGLWTLVEDHRQQYDATGVKCGGTPYWLDGDTHKTSARYMTELGPLPDGASLVQPEKPEPTPDELAAQLRGERDTRITACDWVITRHRDEIDQTDQGEGTTLSADEYAAWLAYRKALRDLPSVEGFPWDGGGEETPWPVEPE